MEKLNREDLYACPSFSCYSTSNLSEIAVKIAGEDADRNDNGDFEFALVRDDKEFLAQELFENGQIGTIFPVFNRNLMLNHQDELHDSCENERMESSIAIPLSKLLIEDRDEHERDSCSSSEADELENNPADRYCVWRPKTLSPSQCKKSKSTGSTSKWRFRDFMRRSNSEGKDSFVFLTPKHREEKLFKKKIELPMKSAEAKGAVTPPHGLASAHEAMYMRNRAVKEGNKKKSYLPYKRDLIGFFANVNGLGHN